MELHGIKAPDGSSKKRKRVGRGPAAGGGKTAGRGQKGAKSRSGSSRRFGYEGGQNPLQRRLPKLPGFKNLFKKQYQIINLSDFQRIDVAEKIDPKTLYEKGIIKSMSMPVKLLGSGEVTKKVNVEVHACSKSALSKVEEAGGKVEIIA